MNACARCSVHDDGSRVDGRRCKRSFRSTQRSIRGGPTERRPSVRPSDRECQSCSSSGASQLCQPAKLVSSSPPFSSPFLSVLPRVARRLKTLFCPHTARSPDYEQYIWTTQQCRPLSLNNKRERTSSGRYGFRRQRQTHPGADRHITYN